MTDTDLIKRLKITRRCDDGYEVADILQEAINALDAHEWKPIDHNTPHLEDVLVKSEDHKPVIAWHGDGSIKRPYKWLDQYYGEALHFAPTHWKPIGPPPPMEANDD